jgi:UDP-glucose 4-epimerase
MEWNASRCFGYVLDAVEALIRIAKSEVLDGEILNIGNDREITIADLASMVRTRLRSCSKIVYVPYEAVYGHGFEDMFRRVPSLKKLEDLIGFRPMTPLEPIIDAIAKHIDNAGQSSEGPRCDSVFPSPLVQPS